MRRAVLLAAIPGLLGVWACQRRAETPPEVARAFRDLVASLDESVPGASLSRLRDFARRNEQYATSPAVEAEVEAWRAKLEPPYRKSRDLVRAERFDEAEPILKDLAPLEDDRAGTLAREFLAFEFLQLKACAPVDAGRHRGSSGRGAGSPEQALDCGAFTHDFEYQANCQQRDT